MADLSAQKTAVATGLMPPTSPLEAPMVLLHSNSLVAVAVGVVPTTVDSIRTLMENLVQTERALLVDQATANGAMASTFLVPLTLDSSVSSLVFPTTLRSSILGLILRNMTTSPWRRQAKVSQSQ